MKRLSEHVGAVLSDRYVLLDLVGQGGSGVVYLARDLSLGRKVAVKLLHEGLSSDQAFLRRFRAEAKSAASLNHPNIVRVFDWGEAIDVPYLVFEFLAGGTLRNLLDTGYLLTIPQAARIALEIAQALSYAHGRGYVHRDVKPSNLLFDEEGRIRVADFGIARALSEAAWTEPVDALIGTARYSSPEQAMGRPSNQAADMFSFALVIFETITGDLPFPGDTTLATLIARTQRDIVVPASFGALRPIVETAGARDVDQRATAAHVASELSLLVRTLPVPDPLPIVAWEPKIEPTDPPTQIVPLSSLADGIDLRTPSIRSKFGKTRKLAADRVYGLNQVGAPGELESVLLDSRALFDQDEPSSSKTSRSMGNLKAQDRFGDDEASVTQVGFGLRSDVTPSDGVGSDPLQPSDDKPRTSGVVKTDRKPSRNVKASIILGVALLFIALVLFITSAVFAIPHVKLPNLVGKSRSAATTSLTGASLKLGEVTFTHSTTVAAGHVISEFPQPGSSVPKNSKVALVVSIGPPNVNVPSVIGQSRVGAAAALIANHLTFGVTTAYSETVATDNVISETQVGQSVRPGTIIDLVVSLGPQPRTVPNLVGITLAAAQGQVSSLQLQFSQTQAYSNAVPAGLVISQTVPPGNQVARGSTVGVVVSLGPHTSVVPDLTGMSLSQAQNALSQVGLSVGTSYGPSGSVIVILQDPAGGSTVLFGSSVTIWVTKK